MSQNHNKIVFLDRDGVINEFPGDGNYVTRVKDFHFIPGALEALKRLTDNGYTIFVVSNQAGVGKGVYSQDKLKRITRKMMDGVKKAGARIQKVYYCTHRSDAGCDCRKPEIGSVKKALSLVNKPKSFAKKTYFVGDTKTDIEAGKKAGCQTIFVLSGRETREHIRRKWNVKPDYIVSDLKAATKIIIDENSRHSHLRGRGASKSR